MLLIAIAVFGSICVVGAYLIIRLRRSASPLDELWDRTDRGNNIRSELTASINGDEFNIDDQFDMMILAGILRRLDQCSHGALGITKGLRRISWLLSNLNSECANQDILIGKIRSAYAGIKSTTFLELRKVFAQVYMIGFKPEVVKQADKALNWTIRDIRALIHSEFGADIDMDKIETIKKNVDNLDKHLAIIRGAMREMFVSDLNREVEVVLHLQQAKLEKYQLMKNTSRGRSAVPVVIDRTELSFVVDNLVENAINATAHLDRPALNIHVGTLEGRTILAVRDNGSGIGNVNRHDDGEAFDRITQMIIESTGLMNDIRMGFGLARTKEILAKWGGGLSVAGSGIGGGTTAVLILQSASSNLEETPEE